MLCVLNKQGYLASFLEFLILITPVFFERYIGNVDLKESRSYGLKFTSLRIQLARRDVQMQEAMVVARAEKVTLDLDRTSSSIRLRL